MHLFQRSLHKKNTFLAIPNLGAQAYSGSRNFGFVKTVVIEEARVSGLDFGGAARRRAHHGRPDMELLA
jgi:hypothetical protein